MEHGQLSSTVHRSPACEASADMCWTSTDGHESRPAQTRLLEDLHLLENASSKSSSPGSQDEGRQEQVQRVEPQACRRDARVQHQQLRKAGAADGAGAGGRQRRIPTSELNYAGVAQERPTEVMRVVGQLKGRAANCVTACIAVCSTGLSSDLLSCDVFCKN